MKLETFIVLKTMNIDKCSKSGLCKFTLSSLSFPNISLSFLYDFVNMHQCISACACNVIVIEAKRCSPDCKPLSRLQTSRSIWFAEPN